MDIILSVYFKLIDIFDEASCREGEYAQYDTHYYCYTS